MVKRGTPPARRRNAAATRAAILGSARQAFARAGYDGVGVREIAEGAGVTAMLVNRYFGSKEQLFAEVIADIMATPIILTPHTLTSSTAGDEIAAALVKLTTAGGPPLDGFSIMLHSASSPRAAEIGREQIEAHYHKRLTAALRGPHASAARRARAGTGRRHPGDAADDRDRGARRLSAGGAGQDSCAGVSAIDGRPGAAPHAEVRTEVAPQEMAGRRVARESARMGRAADSPGASRRPGPDLGDSRTGPARRRNLHPSARHQPGARACLLAQRRSRGVRR